MVSAQLALAYYLGNYAPMAVLLAVAYVFGGFATANLFLANHELSHNLAGGLPTEPNASRVRLARHVSFIRAARSTLKGVS